MFNSYCNTVKGFVKAVRSGLAKKVALPIILVALISILLPSQVLAASNGITIGTLTLYPSLEVCSVILSYTGDDNNNATVNMQWRVHATSAWKQGMDMTKDTRATVVGNEGSPSYITNAWKNQFRAVILLPLSVLNSSGTGFTVTSITPNTTYDIQITVNDPDGVTGTNPATGTFTTWQTNPASSGFTYYVSTTGNDSNDGSASDNSHAWKTLAHAAGAANAGATIKILPGTYASVTVTRSGTASNYITWVSNDTGNPAVISSSSGSPVTINGASFNRFSYLKVTETSGSPCFYITGASQRNIIEYNAINVNDGSSAYWSVGVAMPNNLVSDTIIRNNTFNTNASGSDGGPFCVEMDYSLVKGTVFCDNVVSNSGGNFGDTINNGLYMNGHAYRNIISGCNDDGIEFENEGICCTLWCNIIKNCFASSIGVAPVTVGPVYVFRNVIPGSAIGSGGNAGVKEGYDSNGFVYLYHNTFAYSAESIITDSADNPNRHEKNAVYRNNIFYNTGAGYIVQYNGYGDGDWDFDLMYNGSSGTSMKWFGTQYSYSGWRSAYSAQEAHGLNSNPSLTTTTGDVSLKATSPCINKGVIINGFNDADSAWAYSGTAADIGALEYNSGSPANNLPVAANDTYTTAEDAVLNVAATGVLSNDTDTDSNPLTAALAATVSHGTLNLNSNGSFTYTPAANYNGTDTFTYRANDGQANSNTATVTITITAVNNAPVAVNDTYATTQNTALNVAVPGVLNNDTDTESAALTAALVATVSHGTLTLNSNGSFAYTPASGYTGTDSFTYRANDGQANSNTVTVTITINAVNSAPVAVNDAYTTAEGAVLNVSAPGVLSNDSDAEGTALTAALVATVSHGTLTLNTNGSFAYTPASGYAGTDIFTYRANDGQANSNTATVTININAVNSAPVLTSPGNKSVTEGKLLAFTISATDTDNDSLTYSAANLPSGALFNPVTRNCSWTPAAGQAGNYANVHFEVTDGVNIASANITITVNTASTAVFSVSNMTIRPAIANPNSRVSIWVIAKNSGKVSGSYTVTLKINGVAETSKVVTLAAGSSQWVTFMTSKGTQGTYTVEVNGLAGSFQVKKSSYW
jgi:VCBS repeat-containing protein